MATTFADKETKNCLTHCTACMELHTIRKKIIEIH